MLDIEIYDLKTQANLNANISKTADKIIVDKIKSINWATYNC